MAQNERSGSQLIEELSFLIEDGNNEKVKSVLKNYLSNTADPSKATLLHYAARCGNEKVTEYLLDQDFKVDAQDSDGNTPLMVAVKQRHDKIITILIDKGADIMMFNVENKSALHMACEEHFLTAETRQLILYQLTKRYSDSKQIAQELMKAGCHLYQAAYLNNAKVLEHLLEQGFPVSSVHPASKQTALHIASELGDIDSVKILLKYGANVNALDVLNSNAIFYIYNSPEHSCIKLELIQILLNLKVSLTSYTSTGYFQISPILMGGNDKAIRLILQANIDFIAKDKTNDRNILHHLAVNKNPGVAQELKLHTDKFDVNVVDKSGLNPLYVAMLHANVDMVQFLLSQGATPNCKHNLYGYTPLFNAYSRFKPDFEQQTNQCIELLLQHNVDPQFVVKKSGKQLTVFDIAAKTNSLNSLKPVIAYSGVLEGHGTPIKDFYLTKINSCQLLKKYFNRCRKLLRQEVCKSLTLLKLLGSNDKKIVQYVGNKELILKLIRLSYKQNLKYSHPYYYNTLKRRISKGIQHRRYLDEIAKVVCKIFENRCDKGSLIVDKFINCLNDESLQQLYQLSKSNAVIR